MQAQSSRIKKPIESAIQSSPFKVPHFEGSKVDRSSSPMLKVYSCISQIWASIWSPIASYNKAELIDSQFIELNNQLLSSKWFEQLNVEKQVIALWLASRADFDLEKLSASTLEHTSTFRVYPGNHPEGVCSYLTSSLRAPVTVQLNDSIVDQLIEGLKESGAIDCLTWKSQNWIIADPWQSLYHFSFENI